MVYDRPTDDSSDVAPRVTANPNKATMQVLLATRAFQMDDIGTRVSKIIADLNGGTPFTALNMRAIVPLDPNEPIHIPMANEHWYC